MLRFELVSVPRCRHYSLSPIQRKKILLKCEKRFFYFHGEVLALSYFVPLPPQLHMGNFCALELITC